MKKKYELPLATAPHLAARLLWLLLGLAALFRLYMAMLDIHVLLDQGLIQDDAFYYYEIAKYFLINGIPSFDGINATNGFHPLWQIICLPVFYLWQGETPLRIMLLIASAFDIASIYLVYLLLLRLTRQPWAALCGAAIVALHGVYIRTWFNGLETALHLFTLLLFLHHYLLIRSSASMRYRDHLYLGLLVGFAFLARTDSAIILLVMLAWLYLPLLLRGNISRGFCAASIALLLVSPWLLWNQIQFGSIVQISGQNIGNAWLTGGAQPDLPFSQNVALGIQTSLAPVRIVFEKMFRPDFKPPISGYGYLLTLLVLLLWFRRRNTHFRHVFSQLSPFLSGVIILFLYHAGVRHFVRGWYNAPVLLALVLLMALLLAAVFSTSRRRYLPAITCAVLTVCLLFAYSPAPYTFNARPVSQDPRIAAALWLNQHSAEDALIGAANAGIVGYYANRPLINLDGVVNRYAFHARNNNELHRYIYESGIDYLTDHSGSMIQLCAVNAFYRCEEVARWNKTTLVVRVLPPDVTP